MRILIVEDEVLVALTMDAALHEAGFDVVGLSRDEAGALLTAEELRPDLALVDLKLARGGSGAAVAREMRRTLGIPSIFVSGSPGDCRKVGYHIGVLGCLRKPFTPDELIESVETAAAVMAQRNPDRVPDKLDLYYVT